MTEIPGLSGVYFQAKARPRHGHGSIPQGEGGPQPQERFEKTDAGSSAPPDYGKQVAQTKANGRVYYDAKADAADCQKYYGELTSKFDSLSPKQLFQELSDLVTRTHTTPLDYSPSQELYPWVDVHPDMKVKSIYSPNNVYTSAGDPAEADAAVTASLKSRLSSMAKDMAEWAVQGTFAHLAEALGPRIAVMDAKHGINCEHVVPQSWFEKQLPMRGDLHHLFACDIDWNSTRGNLRYADFPEFDAKPGGPEGKVSGSKDRFEPAGGKGAVARATLYFLMRYPGEVGDKDNEYNAADIKVLVDWARDYPVTDYEKHRNQAIFQRQGNRNPLIDFPQLVGKVDFTEGLGAAGKK